jgi:hypothetical protein
VRTISDTIAELVHAANIVPRLSDAERLLLLNRAHVTIREGHDALGVEETIPISDIAVDLVIAKTVEAQLSDEEFKTLFQTAELIRSIQTQLDTRRRQDGSI